MRESACLSLRTWILWGTLVVISPVGLAAAEPAISFDRQIRPLLSDNCFQCHGPDKAQRKANLRLDTETGARADLGGYQAVTPGDPHKSELYARIASDDADLVMPPADSGKRLSPKQKELFRKWIEQGAQYEKHWAFVPPVRPPLPKVQNRAWPKSGIDYFVLARLEREGLTPSPEAHKTTLLRRVTLDLTGLPPTLAEIDAFLADDSPDAYEEVVDRLLESPRFGERMAVPWLNAARYADTSGYQNDGPREMWRWRDWVIEAFNSNMPFDRFTIEQLAGDLLPHPTLEQRIATGFNRNHRGNAEGGIIPEEYQVEYVVDRVDTTATVWLGLTMGCARCHEHKYDPIAQREFYQLFAFFNNIPEYGRAIKEGNSPPFIKAPTREQQERLKKLDQTLAAAEQDWKKLQPQIAQAQSKWEAAVRGRDAGPLDWSPSGGLIAHFELDQPPAKSDETKKTAEFVDGPADFAAGMLGQAARLDGRRFVTTGDVGKFGYFDKFSFGGWVHPDKAGGTILSRMTDVAEGDGYYLQWIDGKIHVNLVKRWLDDSMRVETKQQFRPDRWYHLMVTYDGSRVAEGITLYVNGEPAELAVNHDFLNQTFANDAPFRIGGGGGAKQRFHGLVDEVRVYQTCLSPPEVQVLSVAKTVSALVEIPRAKRSQAEALKLRRCFLAEHAPAELRQAHQRLLALRRQREQLVESFPTVMVMQEMENPRPTHVLERGEYNKPKERVRPGVPEVLHAWPQEAPSSRLGLAKWLVSPKNPLTARVTVNRFWQLYFGRALVKTVEDFGSQGERPTHPALLDWLATEFVKSGWDVKALQKQTVMSATYRQSSAATPELLDQDPENRLLARGPRFRLPPEMVRDQALAVSGLLVNKLGGPSVKPYQPEGLWQEIATDTNYEQDHGPDLYRRSLYTYWKRTVANPTLIAFDAAPREMCTVRVTRTNTPLQALTLLNDVTFTEAARVMAERIMHEGGDSPESRLAYGFRLATARKPSAKELQVIVSGFQRHRQHYRDHPAAAKRLISIGEAPRDQEIAPDELAAYTVMASLILNLDEVITKE